MKNNTYALTSLVVGILLSGCSDQGYVSVRIEPRATTDVSSTARLVTTRMPGSAAMIVSGEDPSYLEEGPVGSRRLLVTVTEVNVKVKAEKESKKPKKHKGTCNEGEEAGEAHDDDTDQNEDGEDEANGDNNDESADDSESEDDSASNKSKTKHQNWTQIFSGHEQVDLFDPGSAARFVAGGDVPTGQLKEIRLVLSGDVTLVANGVSSAVRCPSCSTSGFKIKTHGLAVIAGESIALSLDLSHALRGDASGYVLHPVIHLGKASCGDDGEDEDDNVEEEGEH